MPNPAAIRSALSAAASGLAGFLETVWHQPYTGDLDGYSSPDYGPKVPLQAMVQRKRGTLRDLDGNETRYRVIVGFIGAVKIGPRDKLSVSDGNGGTITGPLLTPTGGFLDPSTGEPFKRTVYLG